MFCCFIMCLVTLKINNKQTTFAIPSPVYSPNLTNVSLVENSYCYRSNYLLKFATMIGIGRVIQRTPHIAHKDPTSFPPAVVGAMSP